MKKRDAVIATVMILILAGLVNAADYERSDLIKLDVEPPSIDELDIINLQEGVNELSWWVSDNLELSGYEIYKNGVLVKTKAIGGIKQSSKYRDQEAWNNPVYTFIVYDTSKHATEKNITLNTQEEQQKIQEAIEQAMPAAQEEQQVVVTAEPEPAQGPVEEETEVPAEERPAEIRRSNGLLVLILVLIILALLWRAFSQNQKPKSVKHKRYKDIGMHKYMHTRKKRK